MKPTAKIFKTEHYSKQQIARLQERANAQQKKIARWFWGHPAEAIGPTYLHQVFFPNFPEKRGKWEINSTRRAITNLTDILVKGGLEYPPVLIMTDETCKSLLGGTEHLWRWRRPEEIPTSEPEQLAMFGGAPSVSHAYNENLR